MRRFVVLSIACLAASVAGSLVASDCSAQVVYAPRYGYGGMRMEQVYSPPGTIYSRGRFAALPYVTPYQGSYGRYGYGGWGPNTRAWARFEEVEALRGIRDELAWDRR